MSRRRDRIAAIYKRMRERWKHGTTANEKKDWEDMKTSGQVPPCVAMLKTPLVAEHDVLLFARQVVLSGDGSDVAPISSFGVDDTKKNLFEKLRKIMEGSKCSERYKMALAAAYLAHFKEDKT